MKISFSLFLNNKLLETDIMKIIIMIIFKENQKMTIKIIVIELDNFSSRLKDQNLTIINYSYKFNKQIKG
jgi:hypothetical protein